MIVSGSDPGGYNGPEDELADLGYIMEMLRTVS